ncbi:MAG: transposase [Candidatus Binatia bacterium]
MARIPRLTMAGEPAVYHVISRTALDGFVLGEVEKDYLLTLIQRLSAVYFTEVLGFCLMGNHFHLLVRMLPEMAYSDAEVRTRFQRYYGSDSTRQLMDGQIPTLRAKWASLSEYVKEIKQRFSRWYNKRYGRKGFFWSERFKSVLVENGDTLINCLAYIDLNPVRAGLVALPEDYRWCSLAYHVQTGNKDDFLSLDFGLGVFGNWDTQTRLRYYRRYVYENGAQPAMKGALIDPKRMDKEAQKGFALTPVDRLRYRTRYFTDSGVIGTKAFVARCAQIFERHFISRHAKRPRSIVGLPGVYALNRLADTR